MTYLDDLAAANPVRGETSYDAGRAATLVADITAGRVTAPAPPPAPTRRPWLVGGIAVAAAATLTGILVIPPLLPHDEAQISPGLPIPTTATATASTRATPTSAAAVLRLAAEVVERSPDPKPTATTQFWRSEVLDIGHGSLSETGVDRVTRQATVQIVWAQTFYHPIDPQQPSYELQDRRPAALVSGDPSASRLPAAEIVRINMPPEGSASGGWLNPTAAWIATLPRAESELRARLYADAGGSGGLGDGAAFQYAANALWWNRLPSDVRAPLLRVMASIPGISVVDAAVVLGERTGCAITVTTVNAPERRDLVVDPVTGQIIGVVQVSTETRGDQAAGTRTGSRQFVSRSLVNAVPDDLRWQPVAPSAPSSLLSIPPARSALTPSRS